MSLQQTDAVLANGNLSYILNHLGPWGDPLVAGVAGSAAMIGITDPFDSASAALRDFPFPFSPGALVPEDKVLPLPEKETSGGPSIFAPLTSVIGSATGFTEEKAKEFSKYALVAFIGLIILLVGLVVLTWPAQKIILKEGARAAAAGG